MCEENELRKVVKETLRKEGFLNRLHAEVRVRVMGLLSREALDHDHGPPLPREVLLLNELIREYMDWMAYTYSTSVFIAEAGLPAEHSGRGSLERRLAGGRTTSASLPLLLHLLRADLDPQQRS